MSAYAAAVAGALTFALTAVAPVRSDPREDERAYAADGVGASWYDDDDDGDREWREGQREHDKALREHQQVTFPERVPDACLCGSSRRPWWMWRERAPTP